MLIGFMGAGKTTLGKGLADKLSYSFRDLDEVIVEREGKSIPELFAVGGETAFRAAERAALESLKDISRPTVLAAGGGTPCFGDNLSLLRAWGDVVYLHVSPTELAARLAPQKANRPLIASLRDEELVDFIETLLTERTPYYMQADIVLENPTLEDLLDSLKKD